MALAIADRVLETTTTTGTGTVNLGGAKSGGYQTFVAGIGSTNTCHYCIVDPANNDWEVGLGTVTDATPDTLSRDTILDSSNAGAAVNFAAGTKDVFCVLPAMVSGTEQIQLSAILNAGGFKLTNVADPASAQDAATRSWTLAQISSHELVTDLTPQLGGDLDVNDNAIVSTNGGDVVFTADAPGDFIFNNGDFTADFDNATVSNRTMFKTSTLNQPTSVHAIPNGTATHASFGAFGGASVDPDNGSYINLSCDGTTSAISSTYTGTGSALPIALDVGGNVSLTIEAGHKTKFHGDITADWSSAPGSRIALKSSTTNGISAVTITPNGTGTEAYIVMEDNSTVGNNQFVSLGLNATAASINSSKRGTGTAVPFQIIMDGSPVLEVETDFTLNVANVTNYETLVTADDDIPNRKWVTDQAYLQAADLTGYLQNIVEDTTPQLGGGLDVNGNIITSAPAATDSNGGPLAITAAAGDLGGDGGTLTITSGAGGSEAAGGALTVQGGAGGSTEGDGAPLYLYGGAATTDGFGGEVELVAGNGVSTGDGGGVTIGSGSGVSAGNIRFQIAGATKFTVEADGTLSVPIGTYETLVTADDDIPNKKYVDDAITAGGLQNVVEDTSPQLGGNLDVNGFDITALTGGQAVEIRTANHSTVPGTIRLFAGQATGAFTGGTVHLQAGTSATGNGGRLYLYSSDGPGAGGDVEVRFGDDTTDGDTPGNFRILRGVASSTELFKLDKNGIRIAEPTSAPTSDTTGYAWVYIDPTSNNLTFRDEAGTVTDLTAGGISNVVEDTTPQLGGTLDSNGFAGNFDAASAEIPLTTNVTGGAGDTVHPSFMLAASKGSNMGNGFGVNMLYQIQDDTSGLNTIAEIRAVRTDHDTSGTLKFVIYSEGNATDSLNIERNGTLNVANVTNYENLVTADDDIPNRKWVTDQGYGTGTLSNVVEDTSPQLGGDLDAQTRRITSSGTTVNINFASAKTSGNAGQIKIEAQDHSGAGGFGGNVTIEAGSNITNGSAGALNINGGDGTTFGGDVKIDGGNAVAGSSSGGNVLLAAGYNTNTGLNPGYVMIYANDGNVSVPLRMREARDNGTNYVQIRAPHSITTSRTWYLPDDDPTTASGQFLTTDAAGNLSFAAGGIANVVEDTTPQLGGDLDVNGKDITSTTIIEMRTNGIRQYYQSDTELLLGISNDTNIYMLPVDNKIFIECNNVGVLEFSPSGVSFNGGTTYFSSSAVSGQGLLDGTNTDGEIPSAKVVYDTIVDQAGIANVVEDTTPELGGDLDMAGNDIYEDANPGTQGSPLGKFIGRWNTLDVAYMEFQSGSDTVSKDAGQIAFYTQEQGGSGGIRLLIDEFGRLITGGSDATGAEGGSVTVSTGNSGVSTINAAHDDLIVEGSGDTGIVILSPDANKSQLRFGSPGDTSAAVLRWEYGTAGATVAFEMGSATAGADTFIMGGNANRSIGVFSQGHTIIGDTASDVLPVDDGLVVSTGNSGATTAPAGADDLIVEGSGNTGITVLCPDLSIATVKLGTPTDTGGAHIKWDYTNKLCSVGAITPSGETVLIYDNGTQGAIVDSTGRFVVGTASDALGAEAGAVTISTGNSGATTASVDSDDFIIESAGNTGMTIFSPNTGFGQFKFGDPDDASVGAINYSHSVNAMTFKANAIQTLRFDSTGRSLFGSTTPDAVGAEAGSVTISTGDSGSSAPAPGADDLVIESDGEAGITIATPATSTGNIYFGDASVGKVGYISYDHNVNELIVGSDATEILRIVDSGIRIVQGYDTAVAQEGLTPFYQLHRTASSKPSFATVHWSSSGGSTHTGGYTMARSNSDTEETYTAVVDNLVIGQIRWAGSDGTQFQNGAEIEATAKGTWTATSNPCEINFSTCDVNEFALVERMKLTPPGRLVVGSVDSDALGSVVGITISSGDSGVSSVSGVADEFVIEHATSNGGMSILTANNLASNIIFGDPDNNAIGRINYAHSTDRMLFTAGGQASLQILSDGSLNVSGVTNYETLVTADDDIPNKKYVDDRYSFLVTAEENVALDTATNSGFQWSFGNGATNQYGVALPVACEVTHLTLCEKANTAITATVQLVKNGVAVSGATVSVSAAASGTQTLGTPVSFSAGDRLSFVTSSGTAQGAGGVVSALCRST